MLSEDDRWADEIIASVSVSQPASIRACLLKLVKKGVIVRVKRGIYRRKEVLEVPGAMENSRKDSENVKTINSLLRISERYLEDLRGRLEKMSGSKMTLSQFIGFVAESNDLMLWY